MFLLLLSNSLQWPAQMFATNLETFCTRNVGYKIQQIFWWLKQIRVRNQKSGVKLLLAVSQPLNNDFSGCCLCTLAFPSCLLSQIRGSAVPGLEWHLESSQGERGKGAPPIAISGLNRKSKRIFMVESTLPKYILHRSWYTKRKLKKTTESFFL